MDNTDVLNYSLEYSIRLYIKDGEDRDDLLKRFEGNKVELVKFLRRRHLDEYIDSCISTAPEPAIKENNDKKKKAVSKKETGREEKESVRKRDATPQNIKADPVHLPEPSVPKKPIPNKPTKDSQISLF